MRGRGAGSADGRTGRRDEVLPPPRKSRGDSKLEVAPPVARLPARKLPSSAPRLEPVPAPEPSNIVDLPTTIAPGRWSSRPEP
jgi:hypothetical protein